MAKELAPDGFTAVLVDVGEDATTVAREVKARGYSAPVVLDPDMRVARAYGVRATPTVVLIGRDGRVLTTAVGPRSWTGPEGRALIRRLVAGGRAARGIQGPSHTARMTTGPSCETAKTVSGRSPTNANPTIGPHHEGAASSGFQSAPAA
ncbi:MAG: TlpA family protein disulfide reductase [Candidatus Rokubacteria bacterium]|nr:TlpA family protein disulfide reductase [Candidatus Rokubacteria bacterium]